MLTFALLLIASFVCTVLIMPTGAAQAAGCSGISGPGIRSGGGNCPSAQPAPVTRSPPSGGRVYHGGGNSGANYGAALGSLLGTLGRLGSSGGGSGGGHCASGLAQCPDGGCVPPGSRCCGGGKHCSAGSICVPGGCLSRNSARACPDGRRYCEAGSLCMNDGRCLDLASRRVCADGRNYCGAGAVCIAGNSCLSASSNRVCANGSTCAAGQMCTNDNACLSLASARVCGNGRNYCRAGFICGKDNACIAQDSPRVCGDGRSFCEAGHACNADKRCVPVTTTAMTAPAASAPPPPPPDQALACEADNKVNVDWVFADAGASRTFNRLRDDQYSDFEALMGAQAHNRPVMDGFRRCRAWVEAYLAGKGYGRDRSGQVSTADCRCASVVPTGASGWGGGGPEYRVSNSCPTLAMSVRFIDAMDSTRSDWVSVGEMAMGQSREILAPVFRLVSIRAVQLKRGPSSVTCAFN